MAAQPHDEDFGPSTTEGYKVGEKKSVNEYHQLDAGDDSLKRWKESLGLSTGAPLPVADGDTRRCVITSLALEVEGRPDIEIDLTPPGAFETLKSKTFHIKEGATFRMKVKFRVQHDLLSGFKYMQVVKRKGIRVAKDEEMLGSWPPSTVDKPVHEKKFQADEAPSGMMARGKYDAVSRFVDDDGHEHLRFEWTFEISKEWK